MTEYNQKGGIQNIEQGKSFSPELLHLNSPSLRDEAIKDFSVCRTHIVQHCPGNRPNINICTFTKICRFLYVIVMSSLIVDHKNMQVKIIPSDHEFFIKCLSIKK